MCVHQSAGVLTPGRGRGRPSGALVAAPPLPPLPPPSPCSVLGTWSEPVAGEAGGGAVVGGRALRDWTSVWRGDAW